MNEIRQQEQSEKAQRANRIFEERIGPGLGDDVDPRAYVAIDLASNDFEIDRNQLAAANRLMERRPKAQGRIWFRRVGSPVTHHLGGRVPQKEQEEDTP
jgi:ribosomal protein L16/L10AE